MEKLCKTRTFLHKFAPYRFKPLSPLVIRLALLRATPILNGKDDRKGGELQKSAIKMSSLKRGIAIGTRKNHRVHWGAIQRVGFTCGLIPMCFGVRTGLGDRSRLDPLAY